MDRGLATHLGKLQHTNNNGELGLICVPGFSTAGMSDEQANATGTLALALSEAVIETLEKQCGYRVVAESEYKRLLKNAQPAAPPEDVTLQCNRCHQDVLKVSTRGRVDVKLLTNGLAGHRCA
ncbi:hypothetical protein [Mycolicibacterium gilvum]|uniref:hypothetical protein n=1 Tax=Mycolicibacterium gilvum TaxID=1804 RepID=UPI0040467492